MRETRAAPVSASLFTGGMILAKVVAHLDNGYGSFALGDGRAATSATKLKGH